MLGPALALTVALNSASPCHVPKHEAVIMEEFAHGDAGQADLAIFDLATASQTCDIPLPGGPSPVIAVAADGTIYAAIQPHNMTEYTTDAGHLAVFNAAGQLIHRLYDGMHGIFSVQLDNRGHLFVDDAGSPFVNGASVRVPHTFAMYDAKTLRKIRSFALGEEWFDATVSPDGRYLAVSYDLKRDSGRVDIIDPASGKVIRQISVPAERLNFEGTKLYIGSQVGTSVVTLPNGVPRRAPKIDDSSVIIDGVAYSQQLSPFVMPGQGTQTTTYRRRRVSDGMTLRPIVASGIASFPFISTPSVAAATATPGPEITVPEFPSVSELRSSFSSARGIAFDDAVRGRHYTYVGELARIDIPDKNAFVLVDCSANVATVANTSTHTYSTFSIDPPVTIAPQAPRAVTAVHPSPTLVWRVESLAPGHFNNANAQSGYRIVAANGSASSTLPNELNEREYATVGVAYPSCATRTYGGEPLPVLPQRLFDLTDSTTRMLEFAGYGIRLEGTLPAISPGMLLVHAQGMQPDGTIKVAVDVKNIRSVSAADVLSQFAIPPGYQMVTVSQY